MNQQEIGKELGLKVGDAFVTRDGYLRVIRRMTDKSVFVSAKETDRPNRESFNSVKTYLNTGVWTPKN